ncbi:unnamed protein product [Linum trigynum]|uniref:Uncharacterized protein n=1 Tax=Linum trigynum TaxID=586398 RepID=A0AAV2EQ90_9ROSI
MKEPPKYCLGITSNLVGKTSSNKGPNSKAQTFNKEVATNEVMEKEDTNKEEANPKKGERRPSRNERKAAKKASPVGEYTPPLPYPTRMYKERLENECRGFMEMLRNLRLNIPFLEVMAQMPRDAKYLKGFLEKKPKLESLANVTLGEEYSAYLLNRLPKKRSDPHYNKFSLLGQKFYFVIFCLSQ